MRHRTAQGMALLAMLYWVIAIGFFAWFDWRLGVAMLSLTVAKGLIDMLPSRWMQIAARNAQLKAGIGVHE